MCTYKGNVGHLMQHWTLCAVLKVAKRHVAGLNYIDGHAMAPWATNCPAPTDEFKLVKKRVTENPDKTFDYEKAWHHLVEQNNPRGQQDGYPSSAAFVREVWEGPYSLLLCETDGRTAQLIKEWVDDIKQCPQCRCATLFEDDWRKRFNKGLRKPSDVGLSDEALTLVSFDPNLYSLAQKSCHVKNLYQNDLKLVQDKLRDFDGPVIIQLSTYTANGNNQQGAIIASVDGALMGGGFERAIEVRPITTKGKPSKSMMSLVYCRKVSWATELKGLPSQFETWMRGIRKGGH